MAIKMAPLRCAEDAKANEFENSNVGSTASWSRNSTCRRSAIWPGDALRREIRLVVEHLCDTRDPLLNRMERERLIEKCSTRRSASARWKCC